MKSFTLRNLIIGAITCTFMLTIIINIVSTNAMNKQMLIDSSLETNRVYAQKLASITERYIEDTFTTLAFSANYLANYMDDSDTLSIEAERLRTQNTMFNSVLVADANGLVLGVSPPSLELKGKVLTTAGPLEALASRAPSISQPYEGMTGRLLIFISHPIYNVDGNYVGLVGGSIYIKEDNLFHAVLGQHFYDDGSYVYVVDQQGRIIYHKDPSRLNDLVDENPVVQQLMNGQASSDMVTNSKGIDMLAGYSPIAYANWGVVSQRPVEATLAPIRALNERHLYTSLPFFLLVFISCIYFAFKVSQPINRMARITAQSTNSQVIEHLTNVPTWYYETRILKTTLLETLSVLHREVSFFRTQSNTDALTGLMNRRTMDEQLIALHEAHIPYSLAIIDLDKFKSVNDTYGHAVGDEVLAFLAKKMQAHAGTDMLCCRFGGEEFAIIAPHATAMTLFTTVEALRVELEQTTSPCGRPVTLSAGIAEYPVHATTRATMFDIADGALYRAKEAGRNRIEIG